MYMYLYACGHIYIQTYIRVHKRPPFQNAETSQDQHDANQKPVMYEHAYVKCRPLLEEIQGSFADIQGSFAGILGSFVKKLCRV